MTAPLGWGWVWVAIAAGLFAATQIQHRRIKLLAAQREEARAAGVARGLSIASTLVFIERCNADAKDLFATLERIESRISQEKHLLTNNS